MKHLLLSAALALPLPAAAQSVSASNLDSVNIALQELGLSTQTGAQENGAPALVSELAGVTFTILFYNCAAPRGCQDLQLRAVFTPDTEVPLERLNEWNRAALVGKAYQSGDSVILEHPITGADGLSRYSFRVTLTRWEAALRQFGQVFRTP